jgi:NADPH:quinone reductase-like Zn-dependent oxidoreductase
MKAVVVDHYIKDVQEARALVTESPNPRPAAGEVLVEIRVSGINFFDSEHVVGSFPRANDPVVLQLKGKLDTSASSSDEGSNRALSDATAFPICRRT